MCGLTVCILSHCASNYHKIAASECFWLKLCCFSEYAQDKHIQRDDEYYAGDNDNDHDMDEAS